MRYMLHIIIIKVQTATDISDYSNGYFNKKFPSGSVDNATQCVDISVVDDDSLEGNQTFWLSLMTSDPNVFVGTNMTAITIIDNDG